MAKENVKAIKQEIAFLVGLLEIDTLTPLSHNTSIREGVSPATVASYMYMYSIYLLPLVGLSVSLDESFPGCICTFSLVLYRPDSPRKGLSVVSVL